MAKKKKPINWKLIVEALARDVLFALRNLDCRGSGLIFDFRNPDAEPAIHWKDRFADSLDMIPGVEVDRTTLHGKAKKKRSKVKQ